MSVTPKVNNQVKKRIKQQKWVKFEFETKKGKVYKKVRLLDRIVDDVQMHPVGRPYWNVADKIQSWANPSEWWIRCGFYSFNKNGDLIWGRAPLVECPDAWNRLINEMRRRGWL